MIHKISKGNYLNKKQNCIGNLCPPAEAICFSLF